MFLLFCRLITGAHCAGVGSAALADADAAFRRASEMAVVVGKLEMRLGFPRLVVGADAKIAVERPRIDHFAGVHFVLRIPNPFELAKRPDKFRSKHPFEQLSSLLAVAMFTGDRAAVANHEIGGFFHETSVSLQSIGRA